mmetsp:Transcript_3251/g.7542  ORF Transcript_3251/g.7542 Transcript_3251/m.7542 type:complete len:300 (+) Transcript_3251:32-931(+)
MLSLGVVAVVALARTVLACDLWDSSSLRISGLRQHPEYNGEYLRDRDVHQYPSFWQRDPENSCGTAMRKGDCGALEWQMLPAGNASESACLAACEAELQHGCCRFGPAPLDGDAGAVNVAVRFAGTAAPGGCALGHGNVVFEAVPIWSMVAACHGRAVVLQVDGIWRLTPPHVLDLTSAQERHSSYISIAEGLANQSLSEGFQRESAQGRPRRFVDADADVNLHCDEPKTSSSGFATWMLIVPIAAVVLCICGVFIFCHRMSKKAHREVPRPVPEILENPIDDWDTFVGRQGDVPASSV